MASLVNGSGNLGKIFNAVLHSRAAFFFFGGRSGLVQGRDFRGAGSKESGAKSHRPDLRTGNSDGGRISYLQGPGQTRQRTARTVSRALRGSPSICVTRSKVRPQAVLHPILLSLRPRKSLPCASPLLLW